MPGRLGLFSPYEGVALGGVAYFSLRSYGLMGETGLAYSREGELAHRSGGPQEMAFLPVYGPWWIYQHAD